MKLFHTENGKECVYVQMQDIMHLHNTDIPIPAPIFTKIFNGIVIVDNSNRFDFVKFDEEYEVEFFKKLDFVLDYDHYKDFTDEQLNEEAQKFVTKSNQIVEKWNSMSQEEQEQNYSMFQEYENIEYILHFLSEIYSLKHGKISMPFPDFIKLPQKPKKKPFFIFKRKRDVK